MVLSLTVMWSICTIPWPMFYNWRMPSYCKEQYSYSFWMTGINLGVVVLHGLHMVLTPRIWSTCSFRCPGLWKALAYRYSWAWHTKLSEEQQAFMYGRFCVIMYAWNIINSKLEKCNSRSNNVEVLLQWTRLKDRLTRKFKKIYR